MAGLGELFYGNRSGFKSRKSTQTWYSPLANLPAIEHVEQLMPDQSDYQIHHDYVEQLFEWVYCDLGSRWDATRRSSDYNRYHRLNMARLLRHLLSDGTPLALSAARRHKFKLLFLTARLGPRPTPRRAIPSEYEAAKPDLSGLLPGYYVHAYDLDGYLASELAKLGDDRWLSVLDVINFLANSYGGVHLVPHLKDKDERRFAEWNERLKIAGEGVMFERLDQIVPVVLRSSSSFA